MQNVRVISCLGNEAWYLSCMAMQQAGVARQWADYRDREQTFVGAIANKTIMLVPHYHPAARISLEKMQGNWRLLATQLAYKV
jgi:uracil-DNA glycosylase